MYIYRFPQTIRTYLGYICGAIFFAISILPSVALGQLSPADSAFPYMIQGQDYDDSDVTTNIVTGIITPDIESGEGMIKTISRFFRLTDTQYYDDDTTSPATNYVKWILNMLLGLVSFLALIMVIYAFYLIFFSKGEEAVGKAKKILIGVAIALVVMGLSRFITSFFFDIYGTVTGT